MKQMPLLIGFMLTTVPSFAGANRAADWETAKENAQKTQQAVVYCKRYVHAWLNHIDPKSGLIPRNLTQAFYWNAKDAAADNFPFMLLTAFVTDTDHLKRLTLRMLEQEQTLTNRLDSLPDDFSFATQSFRTLEYKTEDLVFGASEYAKDGLTPITEWLGPGPWLDRMQEMLRDVWKHGHHDSKAGRLPSGNPEVNGELMATMSRLYWMTRDETLRSMVFRLADHYFFHEDILKHDSLRLDDHGCEIIAGLSEAYVVASQTDPERLRQYRPVLHAILDRVLEVGANEDGFFYNVVNPASGEVIDPEISDNWGYNYNAFLTVAEIDGVDRFRAAVEKVLHNLRFYHYYPWERSRADGFADSIEGALNLLNRVPSKNGFDWLEPSAQFLLTLQRADGIIGGWHGDGNAARTALMYGLWKSQGLTLSPWRDDLQLGAVADESGTLRIYLRCDWPWRGTLRFDRPRHREYMNMPFDYPRINQFPEWYTADAGAVYKIRRGDGEFQTVEGPALWAYPLSLDANEEVRLTVRKQNER